MTTKPKTMPKNEIIVSEQQPIIGLLEMAMKSNEVDLGKMEKIMEMYDRFQAKEAEKAFNLALNQFQGNKPDLRKTEKVGYSTPKGNVSYSFNPLPKIQKAIDPILSQFGLSYRWKQETKDGIIRITCIVGHVQGYCQETWLEAGHDTTGSKNAIQAIGSTVSYLKRYTLENALGLASDSDDDGQESNKPVRPLEALIPIIDTAKNLTTLKKMWESFTLQERELSKDAFAEKKKEIQNLELDKIAAKNG